MNIAAVIAEYNPLHSGHVWQLSELRRRLGPDTAVLVVLSGHLTQRGEPGLLDKYTRAGLAIQAGADLVLELPSLFSGAGAGYFADGALTLLGGTGLHLTLFCGAEAEDFRCLHEAAKILAEEPEAFRLRLREGLDEGLSFAKARALAIALCLSEAEAEGPEALSAEAWQQLLSSPNNILAIEYLAARERHGLKKKIRTLILPRRYMEENEAELPASSGPDAGTDKHTDLPPQASGTAIRAFCSRHSTPSELAARLQGLLPDFTLGALLEAASQKQLCTTDLLLAPTQSVLLALEPEELAERDGMQEGLAERCLRLLREGRPESFADYRSFVRALTTSRFPRTRIQRALVSTHLGLTQTRAGELRQNGAAYLRPLALNKRGRYIMGMISKNAGLPVVTKPSDFLEHPRDSLVRQQGSFELRAGNWRANLLGQAPNEEFRRVPLLL